MRSRIIKLRAWAVRAKTMHPSWVKLDDEDGKYILMQYTGLEDKDGKEIYEGDIVKYTKHEGYLLPSFTKEIVWWPDNATFGFFDRDNDMVLPFSDYDELDLDVLCWLKVIGNIYENPQLLKP